MTSRSTRLGLIGVITFIVCATAFAPASLVRYALRDSGQLTLAGPTGTIWRGSGDLVFAGTELGRLNWSFAPASLLSGGLGFDVHVQDARLTLAGRATAKPTAMHLDLDGNADMALLAEVLSRYDIQIPGTLAVEHLDVTAVYGSRLPLARGSVKWSGGNVGYRLSGRDHRVTLAPLVGFLDSSSGQPELTVYQVDATTPLMLARVTQDGLATIGITKQFTKLLGEPWPGGEPDHAVVLEVGEKLF